MTKISNQYSLTNVLTADTTNGRVGINNGSPTVALDVTGAGKFSSDVTISAAQANSIINYTSASDYGRIYFSESGTFKASIQFIGSTFVTTARRNALEIVNTTTGDLALGTGDARTFYIKNGGNVGIGTDSPSGGGGSTDRTLSVNAGAGAAAFMTGMVGGTRHSTLFTSSSIFVVETNTAIPIAFNTNGTERMRITSGGNVCIGTTNTSGNLSVKSLSSGIAVNILGRDLSDGAGVINFMNQYATTLGVIECNTNAIYVIRGTGGVYLGTNSTSWTSNSDSRLKNIISPINNALDKLNALNPVIYSWKSDDTNKENIGLIAQDVESVFPQVIDTNKDGFLGVRYTELVPVLVAAIQQQQTQINELKALINA